MKPDGVNSTNIYLSIYLSIYIYIYLSFYVSIYLSTYLSVNLYIYLYDMGTTNGVLDKSDQYGLGNIPK